MASPKSGSKVNTTAPADPEESYDADEPDPVAVAEKKSEQIEQGQGKYGETPAEPHKPPEEEEVETSWIEIELIDEEDNPVPGQRYKIETPDGRIASGTLDENGFARVEGFEPGQCKVTFPQFDAGAWEPA